MKSLISILMFIICTTSWTQEDTNNKPKKTSLVIEMDKQTSIKNPFELRDPFKKKKRKTGKRNKNYGNYLKNGKYSNIVSIEDGFKINQIRIVGVLLGQNRRAIAKIVDNSGKLNPESYIVKEGMKIGDNDAEVKAIVPGGVVLVEKIRNVYDQDEYIETIIPVTSE